MGADDALAHIRRNNERIAQVTRVSTGKARGEGVRKVRGHTIGTVRFMSQTLLRDMIGFMPGYSVPVFIGTSRYLARNICGMILESTDTNK